jgi:predicted aspartyl protease
LRLPLKNRRALPSVDLTLNRQRLPWFVDTGASFSLVLDAASAEKARLPLLRHSRLSGSGVGGSAPGLLGRFDSLASESTPWLGRGLALVLLHQYQMRFAGIPLQKVSINLLGLPVLQRFSYLTFDAPGQELRLGFKRRYLPPPRAVSLPFESKDGRLWVTLRIAGHPVRAFFDTGYAANLRLPTQLASRLPPAAFESWQPEPVQRQLGIGGIELDSLGRLREASIGSLSLRPLAFHASPKAEEAILGWGPFRTLKTTIDFQRQRIWIEP